VSGRARPATVPVSRALQPLDRAYAWPALFGREGLVQYQCAVPDGTEHALERILRTVRELGLWSALTTLKRFGEPDRAPLGFPLAGWALAMDFPARSPRLEETLRRLDEIVVAAGGRVYLAKDSRLPATTFAAMYPRLEAWRRLRDTMDLGATFRSDLGRRLRLVPAWPAP
jgi:decaprenylphospho-beta-D-ribofuranose 2-oxidase